MSDPQTDFIVFRAFVVNVLGAIAGACGYLVMGRSKPSERRTVMRSVLACAVFLNVLVALLLLAGCGSSESPCEKLERIDVTHPDYPETFVDCLCESGACGG